MDSADLSNLSRTLGYTFKNINRLQEALRHSSFVNEQAETNLRDNERLEFLGDAVLNLVVGDLLLRRFPDRKEGPLSRMRADLVNESQLAAVARTIDLGAHILLGKGETQTDGRKKNSILSDTMEAVIAAIYLDGGFGAAFDFIENHFSEPIKQTRIQVSRPDHKSRIQELAQSSGQVIPEYRVVGESGPDHDKVFHIRLTINNISVEGSGKSKKLAEQEAAKKALEIIENNIQDVDS
jgi:ribonuclease III